jgi:chaperonin GroES
LISFVSPLKTILAKEHFSDRVRSSPASITKGVGNYGNEVYSTAIMATKFTPLHDRILVRREEEAGTTRGGLIIPDSAKDKPQEGTVISVGKGKINEEGKLFPLAVKEGDTILFGKYSGTEIKLDGEDFLIMKEEEVLGIVTGTAKRDSFIPRETAGARK